MNRRREFMVVLYIVLVSMLLAACGGSNSDSGTLGDPTNGGERAVSGEQPTATGGNETATDEEPTPVTIMNHFFSATPPPKGNPVEKEIERLTNTKLDIQWVSANNYTDKLNVTLASGDMPDLLFINDPFSPTYITAAKQGAFWDISPFIDDYPNLKATIDDIAWELTKIEGANYGIPRPRPSEGETFFILRKDWLDQLQLKVPETRMKWSGKCNKCIAASCTGQQKRLTIICPTPNCWCRIWLSIRN